MKKTVLLMLLLVLFVGCSKPDTGKEQDSQKKEETLVAPYIIFEAETIYFEAGSNDWFSLHDEGRGVVKKLYGYIIDIEGKVNLAMEGEYPLIYTISNGIEPFKTEKFEVTIIVAGKAILYDANGYPDEYGLLYKMKQEDFRKVETRFRAEPPKRVTDGTMADVRQDEVGVDIDSEAEGCNITLFAGATAGGDGPGNEGNHVIWRGKYKYLGEGIYHVTGLTSSDESDSRTYEAYFILTEKDGDGEIYWFMEYPTDGIEKDMPSFKIVWNM